MSAAVKLARRPMLKSVVKGIVKIPDRVLLHGMPGVGKTTFASQFPKAVIAEADREGSARIDTSRVQIETYQDMIDFVDDLTETEHEYQTLVIDTADAVEAMLWRHICERDKQDSIEAYGYGKGYVAAVEEWRMFLSRLERLRNVKRMGIVILAHTHIKPFKNPEADDFDRYEMKLNARAGALLSEWCDAVLFARFATLVAKDEKTGRTRGVSTGARVLHTVRTAAYDAKNRYGLPEELPLDYPTFSAAVERGTPRDHDTVRSAIAAYLERLPDLVEKVTPLVTAANGDTNELLRIENRLKATLMQRQKESTAS